MSFRHILVHVDAAPASRTRLQLALALARHFGARLSGLHVISEPGVPPYFKPSAVERIAALYAENAREAADQAASLFAEETRAAGAAAAWQCAAGDLAGLIAERARFADLVVLGQFDTESPRGITAFLLPAKVVFGAAAPVLVIPNGAACRELGGHVLVAWDGSREAARAVRDAMPLLQAARHVSLLAVDPLRQGHMQQGAQTSGLVDYLAQHGIAATAIEVSSGRRGATEDILRRARALGADLLVMGAYGHSRVWEFVAGGTTPELLERTTIPVLMSR
jgi:nucleotide-binding universal stress UspA family protein